MRKKEEKRGFIYNNGKKHGSPSPFMRSPKKKGEKNQCPHPLEPGEKRKLLIADVGKSTLNLSRL